MTESEFIEALRLLGRRHADKNDFVILRNECAIQVQYFPGSSAHVELSAPYVGRTAAVSEDYRGLSGALVAPRPMRIVLRKETSADVRAKQSGVAVEVQTGDAAFDERVYVDTPSAPEIVRKVLGEPSMRDGVRALLSVGIGPITLDGYDGRIRVHVGAFSDIRNVEKVVTAFADIANHVPDVQTKGSMPVDRWQGRLILAGAASFLGLFPALFSIFFFLPGYCYESSDDGTSLVCEGSCCTPATGGLVSGVVIGVALAALLWGRIRGTSNAHRLRSWVALFVVVLSVEAAMTLAHVLGGVLLRIP